MKRSEAVRKIAEALYESDMKDRPAPPWNEAPRAHTRGLLKDAEVMLTACENLGMLPPSHVNPEYNRNDADKYVEHPFMEYPIPYRLQKWEKENA